MRTARNAKYRVIPGLSISNRELRERVKNRSIVIDSSGQIYSTDPDITRAARQSRIENARDMVADEGKVQDMKRRAKEADLKMKLDNARQAGRNEAEASKGGNA